MEDKIKEAIKLLKENGYAVIKVTEKMDLDGNNCEANDGNNDCGGCACNICLLNS